MSAYTKQAIKKSFLKLLNERPLSQVTVKAIVEDCGINRKSFTITIRISPPCSSRSWRTRPLCWSLRTSRCARWRNA